MVAHHDPDLALVGCVGCGGALDAAPEAGLVYHETAHIGASCCTFHPYHPWCFRQAPPDPRPWTACAGCGAALGVDDVRAAARWLRGFHARLHGEGHGRDPLPEGLRFVRVRQRGSFEPREVPLAPIFAGGAEAETHAWLGRHFEIVHARAAGDLARASLRCAQG